MPAPREAVAVLKVTLSVLFMLSLLDAAGPAQTSLNDIHVAPREMPPTVTGAVGSSKLIGGSILHVIKTDVKLVLVPVSVTDSMERLGSGLNGENLQLYEGKKPQENRHFSTEDVPVLICVILCTNGSKSGQMDRGR